MTNKIKLQLLLTFNSYFLLNAGTIVFNVNRKYFNINQMVTQSKPRN